MTGSEPQQDVPQTAGTAKGGTMRGALTALGLVVLALFGWSLWKDAPRPGGSNAPATEAPEASTTATASDAATAPKAAASAQGDRAKPAPAPVTQSAQAPAPAADAAATAEAGAPTQTATAQPAPTPPAPHSTAATETPPDRGQAISATATATDSTSTTDATAPKAQGTQDTADVRFDALRATPDGSVTLAGQVDPNAMLEILVDGQVVAKQVADAAGNFAALFDLPPSNAPRALSLRVTGTDGTARASAESLILQPMPASPDGLAVASATPAPGTSSEGTSASAEGQTSTSPAAASEQTVAENTAQAGATAAVPPAPIVAGAEGAHLLAPPSAQLGIDTITFGEGRMARAEGRGAPEGATLSAYLDDALTARATPRADGRWSVDLPGLAPGRHSLRIDASDAGGKVVARAETTFDQPDQLVVAKAGAPVAQSAEAAKAAGGTGDAVKVVLIVRGNTLWAIAREVYGDGILYVRVFNANRNQIRDPDLIYPGQVFKLPPAQ